MARRYLSMAKIMQEMESSRAVAERGARAPFAPVYNSPKEKEEQVNEPTKKEADEGVLVDIDSLFSKGMDAILKFAGG